MKLCDVMLASNGMYGLARYIQSLYSECGNLESIKDEMNKVFSMNGPMALGGMFTRRKDICGFFGLLTLREKNQMARSRNL